MKNTALLAFALLLLALIVFSRPQTEAAKVEIHGEALIGGAFTLTDTLGRQVKNTDFTGRFMLVYLGYTHCPDICPATLSMLSGALKEIGTDADKVAVLFISLDPAHDSPKVLGDYLKSFDPRIIGLTGNEEEIKTVTRAFKAYVSPTPNAGPGNMLITHSGLLYLLDKNGKYIAHFESGVKQDALVAMLKQQF